MTYCLISSPGKGVEPMQCSDTGTQEEQTGDTVENELGLGRDQFEVL